MKVSFDNIDNGEQNTGRGGLDGTRDHSQTMKTESGGRMNGVSLNPTTATGSGILGFHFGIHPTVLIKKGLPPNWGVARKVAPRTEQLTIAAEPNKLELGQGAAHLVHRITPAARRKTRRWLRTMRAWFR